MDIKNQNVIVSGGASGIGAAVATCFSQQGAQVFILDKDERAANKLAAEICGKIVIADVSNNQALESSFRGVIEKYGAMRVCVNCAGIAPAQRIVGRSGVMSMDDFEQVMQVNLMGSFNLMRLCAAEMIGQPPLGDSGERGVIINTASIAAYDGQLGQSAYSASKGAVAAMTLPAAREFSQFGIRVMSIAPGVFDTPLMQAMPKPLQEDLEKSIPFPKRFGMPGEFAKLALHIVSNPYLNGEVIRLDAGLRMN